MRNTHSISGKPSNNKQAAKPPLDARLYRILVEIIKDKYGTSTKEITAKVHSVRKWVHKSKTSQWAVSLPALLQGETGQHKSFIA